MEFTYGRRDPVYDQSRPCAASACPHPLLDLTCLMRKPPLYMHERENPQLVVCRELDVHYMYPPRENCTAKGSMASRDLSELGYRSHRDRRRGRLGLACPAKRDWSVVDICRRGRLKARERRSRRAGCGAANCRRRLQMRGRPKARVVIARYARRTTPSNVALLDSAHLTLLSAIHTRCLARGLIGTSASRRDTRSHSNSPSGYRHSTDRPSAGS